MTTATQSTATAAATAAQFPGDALWQSDWKPSFGEATIQERMSTTATNSKFTLYSSWFCPFAQRAWIVAEETGVDYLWVEINPYRVNPQQPGGYTKKSLSLEEKRALCPGFVEASPRGLVPAIRDHHDVVIWESLPVAEYLDAVFGSATTTTGAAARGASLAGATPQERAMVQIWSAHCTDRIQKQYYKALMSSSNNQSKSEREEALQPFFQECRVLARAMDDTAGPFFLGERFSLVDVALAPFWQRMIWVGGHYFQLEFPADEPEFQRLAKWWAACEQRPSIQSTLVCKERLIASYNDYARNVATSDFAKNM